MHRHNKKNKDNNKINGEVNTENERLRKGQK
jgi:hypothetical protein